MTTEQRASASRKIKTKCKTPFNAAQMQPNTSKTDPERPFPCPKGTQDIRHMADATRTNQTNTTTARA
ncbi:hypothetical protein VTJ04DRAFT_4807 [Mycothermus thermophilus]|uniref:uncharacterized protein n=1 Tax=Humicola insolens TaxID=85995 RepID=UPI00374218A6